MARTCLASQDSPSAGSASSVTWRIPWPGCFGLPAAFRSWAGEPALTVVIWLLVLVNAGFSFWRERRAEQAMHTLRLLLPSKRVCCAMAWKSAWPAEDIVPGDLLILAEGDHIPADARLGREFGLRTNNAVLTGEASPARKTADASVA